MSVSTGSVARLYQRATFAFENQRPAVLRASKKGKKDVRGLTYAKNSQAILKNKTKNNAGGVLYSTKVSDRFLIIAAAVGLEGETADLRGN